MLFEITSPKPIPCVFIPLVFYSFPNNLKSFNRSCRLIPTPVSCTFITSLSLLRCLLPISLIPCIISNFLSSLSLDPDLFSDDDDKRLILISPDLDLFFYIFLEVLVSMDCCDLTNLAVTITCPPAFVNLSALD